MKKFAEICRKTKKVKYLVNVPDDFDPVTAPVRMVEAQGHEEPGWNCDDNGVMTAPTQAELDAEAAEQVELVATDNEFSNSIFANVTIQQAENYIENNVTDLASAKQVLKIMARMMIAERNAIKRLVDK